MSATPMKPSPSTTTSSSSTDAPLDLLPICAASPEPQGDPTEASRASSMLVTDAGAEGLHHVATPDAAADAAQAQTAESLAAAAPIDEKDATATAVEAKLQASDQPVAAKQPPSHGRLLPLPRFILVYTCLALCVLLSALDMTVVACIIPNISSMWGFGQTPWLGTVNLLAQTIFAPVYASLSDCFGRKPMLIAAQVIFMVGTVLCATAPTISVLILGRAIAGMGSAGLFSMVHVVVSDVVTLRKRGLYHGILSSFNGAGSALGPIIGGVFASRAESGWRMAFFFQLPIAGTAALCTVFFLPRLGNADRGLLKSKLKSIDYGGMLLFITGCVFVLLSLNLLKPPERPFTSPAVIGFFFSGLALIASFVAWEGKVAVRPIMPLSIFRNVPVALCFFLNFAFGYCFYASLYFIPVLLQLDGQSVVQSSLSLLPIVVCAIAMSWASGLATSLLGAYKWSLVLAYSLMTVGTVMLYHVALEEDRSRAFQIGTMLVLGVGFGMQQQCTLVACQSACRQTDVAKVTGVRNLWRNVGGVLALAISNVLVHATLPRRLEQTIGPGALPAPLLSRIEEDPNLVNRMPEGFAQYGPAAKQAYQQALEVVFLIFVPVSVAAFLACIVLPEFSLDRSHEGEPVRVPYSSANPWYLYQQAVVRSKASFADSRRPSAATTCSTDSGRSDGEAEVHIGRDAVGGGTKA